MPATFGCPECGEPIAVPENLAGRQMRCAECLTLVEIPFFTRSRPKRRRRRATGWAWVMIAFGMAVIAMVGTYLLVRARVRADRLAAFESQVKSALQDEAEGNDEAARAAIDQALATARTLDSVDPIQLETLKKKRQQLSRQIDRDQREALIVSAEADLSAVKGLLARTPLNAKQAMDLATSAYQSAKQVADTRTEAVQTQAAEIASSLVQSRGVRFDPVQGPFLFDPRPSAAEYGRRLRPILSRFLSDRGFLPEPESSPLTFLWERLAPYHLSTTASESYGANYLQSQNRMTRIEIRLALEIGTRKLWSTYLVARTQVPSHAFSAFESGYIGSSPRREASIELKLYVDALDDMVTQVPGKLANLPRWDETQ